MPMDVSQPIELEVLLPVHNEAASIASTLAEIYQTISPLAKMRFILSEDGSTDGTPQVLRELALRYPMKLISDQARKGYSRAVLESFQVVEAPFVLCLDADGQCNPADFIPFWSARAEAEVLIGWRVHRQDVCWRRWLSGLFKAYYRALFGIAIHDPSCPFVLASGQVIKDLAPQLGVLSQGFWWEFIARCWARGHSLKELPVSHRRRAAGQTQVYRLRTLPAIGWSHVTGLMRIWWDTRRFQMSTSGGL